MLPLSGWVSVLPAAGAEVEVAFGPSRSPRRCQLAEPMGIGARTQASGRLWAEESLRDLWEQMNSCSCLTLIVACIIYWQARDMSRVIRTADPERHGIELSLLRHVSPIEWDNIVLYGEYVLNRRLVRRTRSRP